MARFVSNSGVLRRQLTPLEPLVNQIESAEALDEIGQTVGKTVRDAFGRGTLKEALSGTWLGHAVHPVLTDVVIGSFTSASLLDLVAPDSDGIAAERLIALGLLTYLPTSATGFNDWADTEPVDEGVRRVGLVHAVSNAAGATLYFASLGARRRGSRRLGAALGFLGMGVMGAGAYLGGHLTLTKGVGPDQTVFDPGPPGWTPAADASLLAENRPTRVVVDDTPVLLLRQGENIYAIHDRCSHRGCSLSDGEVEGDEVVCSCHGSRFSLRDGAVKHGPATASQPAFQVRVEDGRIEVRRLNPA
ncbi:MAG TPA: Rieske 2Fe-2S domain-containing protein [Solirubrobacteraceae bacterium]|nr:Rieske 2Fe-2S domain-containing protein [Solirubrobacteraceae bacterium]